MAHSLKPCYTIGMCDSQNEAAYSSAVAAAAAAAWSACRGSDSPAPTQTYLLLPTAMSTCYVPQLRQRLPMR